MTLHSLLSTPLTEALGIKHPIVQGAMALTSGPRLAAAVSSAGGLGIIASFESSPSELRGQISELKAHLTSPDLPWGINLPIIKIGNGARKTNQDYTGGRLAELLDVVAESGAKLFVAAAGLPSHETIERLHNKGMLIAIMAGHPKHARKGLERGVDIIAAQGAEAGGHTGDIGTAVLLPSIIDVAQEFHPPLLHGKPAIVVAAGGIVDGRGLASALVQGAAGAWMGTRFIASEEAVTSALHKQAVVQCGVDGTHMTHVVTGRPLRMRPNWYVKSWHVDKQEKVRELCSRGIIPMKLDEREGRETEIPFLMGQGAGLISDIKPAKAIVESLVTDAAVLLKRGAEIINIKAKL
ncbi:hypothetical protein Cpir12675_004114 [Ceratocystis pirilliformis]|uniref:Nitronate monooxygenase n=1 Tax=Ceratocystis pirilliformis TaxID=259994 RepID=A0ABR3YYM0_9PEZI